MALSAGYKDKPTEEELVRPGSSSPSPYAVLIPILRQAHHDTNGPDKTPWIQLFDLLTSLREACLLVPSRKSSFAHWERRFFARDIGVTRRKLERMSPEMCSHLFGRLTADLAELENPRCSTRPNDLLVRSTTASRSFILRRTRLSLSLRRRRPQPSADEALADAYDAVQTSLQRFKIYLGFVENLYCLYRKAFSPVENEPSDELRLARCTLSELEARQVVDPFLLGASRQSVRQHEARHAQELVPLARCLAELTEPALAGSATVCKGLVLFERLPPGEQISAVNSARALVFEVCELDARGHSLPDSQVLVRRPPPRRSLSVARRTDPFPPGQVARLSTAVRGTCFDAEGRASHTVRLSSLGLVEER